MNSESLRYLNCSIDNTIFLDPVAENEVIAAFMSLSNSNSSDVDGFQIKPVKFVIDLLAKCLTHLYNVCFSTGVFPRKMQSAKVVVLFKKGDRNNFSNYRPISILPVFSKGIEKSFLNRLSSFSDRYNIISPAQYGFRKNKSTELALLDQKEFILDNFEKNNVILGIFLDFTKAFDYVNHDILLHKLHRYGFRGKAHSLISSYLCHRSQLVEIGEYVSTTKPVKSGVPQGSILGPFLFILYINEIVNIDETAKYIIYADDTSLFFSGCSGSDLANRANKTLACISSWASNNNLKLNASKTKAVLFHPRRKISAVAPIVINQTPVEFVKCFKTLGVYFEETMSWNKHTDYLIQKLSQATGLMRRYCCSFPISVNLLLYNSIFSSMLNYGVLIWATTTQENIRKITVLQKRAIRLVSKVPYLSPTRELFKKYNVIRMDFIYSYKLCRCYKQAVVNNCSLINLASLEQLSPIYSTRNPETWKVKKCRTNYGEQMLRHRLPSLLNNFQDISTIPLNHLRSIFTLH